MPARASASLFPWSAAPTLFGLVLFVICALLPRPSYACPVCIDLPDVTLADRLLSANAVVLARPSPENPYTFAITEVLDGTADQIAALPPIPFLIDSTTRRALADNADRAVALAYGAMDEVPSQTGWHRLITASPETRNALEAILREGENWKIGPSTDPARFNHFANLLDHPDAALHRAALIEIARSPYVQIRTLGPVLSPAELRYRLTLITEIPFAPLYILLLGNADDEATRDYVRDRFARALRTPGSQVDAWIVAGAEVDGAAALAQLDGRLRHGPPLDAAVRQRFSVALSVLGAAKPELRPQVMSSFALLLSQDPRLAADIAKTSYRWRDWTLASTFSDLVEQEPRLDPASRYVIELLLHQARNSSVRTNTQ